MRILISMTIVKVMAIVMMVQIYARGVLYPFIPAYVHQDDEDFDQHDNCDGIGNGDLILYNRRGEYCIYSSVGRFSKMMRIMI